MAKRPHSFETYHERQCKMYVRERDTYKEDDIKKIHGQ